MIQVGAQSITIENLLIVFCHFAPMLVIGISAVDFGPKMPT